MSKKKNGGGGGRSGGVSRELGEYRSIPRRDFLQGALVASATALTGPLLKAYGAEGGEVAAQDKPGYYPPALTGMRPLPTRPH